MFVSFLIPSEFEGRPARHLSVFYKQLQAFGRDEIAFIGEAGYFRRPSELRAENRPEWEGSWRQEFEYEPPASLDGVRFATLPADLWTDRLTRLQSSWRLYGHLVTRRLPELEKAIDEAIDTVSVGRDVEAVLAFANVPSLQQVARRRGLPVVHTHFGALRPPAYLMTGYWDRRGVNSRTDAMRRFRAFKRALARDRVAIFSREELLRTLRRINVPDAPDGPHPPFRLGIALQGEENTYVQGLGGLDLVTLAGRHFHRDEILIRHHPGAVTRFSDQFGVMDAAPHATDFVLKCEAVMTVNSGIALEALLLGRRCIVLGDSPWRLAADHTLDGAPRLSDDERLLALNFLVFGYVVPYQLMLDPEYIRWRLTDPPEVEIVRRHQRWYRTRLTSRTGPAEPGLTLSTAAKLLDAVPLNGRPEPLFLFGAGHATPDLAGRLRSGRFKLLGVFDNDAQKWSTAIADVPVGPPRYQADAMVAVSSLTYADEIVNQLRSLGYPAERILRLL